MAGGPSISVLRDIQTLFDGGSLAGLSDRELLERFALGRDATAGVAFEVLVARHGPMVWRVCRNVLPDPNDVQDAFQATFLILVRRSHSIRKFESVGSWLFGVAGRVAARARVEAARRRAAERCGALRVVPAVDPAEAWNPDHAELGPIVQEAVRRLPEKYRAVVVLCYWQGLTQEQAAAQLGRPLGTVRSRLARARALLHRRLTRRGLAPLAAAAAAGLDPASASAPAASMVSIELARATIQAAAQVSAGRALAEVTSSSVAGLVRGILRSMTVMKLKTTAIGLLFIGIGALGVSLAEPQSRSKQVAPGADQDSRPDQRKVQPPLHPLSDYVVEPPDLLLVEVLEALPGRPISGERLVRPDGKISLGFYGDVYLAGLTVPEVKGKIVQHLRKFINDETLGLVERDSHGELVKDPKTHQVNWIDPKDSPRVFVEVTAYNSKNYYILGMVALPGRFPVTGHETILDAITLAGGLTPQADHDRVVLYRVEKGGALQSLPVDIDQITMGGDPTTNYQVLPGDRLVVPRREPSRPGDRSPEPERPTPASPRRQAPPLHFDRHLDMTPDTLRDDAPRPAGRAYDREALRAMERHLSLIEQKLDIILGALKPRTP